MSKQYAQDGFTPPKTTQPNKALKGGANPPKTSQPKPQPQTPDKTK